MPRERQRQRPNRGQRRADSNPAVAAPSAQELAEREARANAARPLLEAEALPALEEFRTYMAQQQRKLEVAHYLDHIEGPRIVVGIQRADGQIAATLIVDVQSGETVPSWDVRSTGKVKTRWVEKIPGGMAGLTQASILQRLIELYLTDFS